MVGISCTKVGFKRRKTEKINVFLNLAAHRFTKRPQKLQKEGKSGGIGGISPAGACFRGSYGVTAQISRGKLVIMHKMENLKGMAYLKKILSAKQIRVNKRYRFYEMKNSVPDFDISTPPNLRLQKSVLGWCGKAVDTLADRLQFRGFENDNFLMGDIYQQNNADILFNSAILSALIAGCCFIYISDGDNKRSPRLEVLDGSMATGRIDPVTLLLKEGYAVLSTDDNGKPVTEAYFTPDYTEIYEYGKYARTVDNPTAYPLLVPIINRPDARRAFGHSRISRSCMDLMQAAARTVKRSEISAEFYSYPQRYALGLDPDAEISDKWKATMSSMLTFSKDEDGDHPTLGQFTQQSMSPHLDHLKMFAAMFAGETGLTMDDLGFVSENPSSAEAIKASHENLRLTARKAQRDFSVGFVNAGYLAASLRDKRDYARDVIYQTKATWEPIFEPDAAMLSGIGDGAIKINQAVPGYFGSDNLRKLTGIDSNGQ